MNQPLDRASIDALTVRLDAYVTTSPKGGKRHAEPFSKTDEGRARRKARRAVRDLKRAWLEG